MEVKAFKKTITAAANLDVDDTEATVYIFALPPESYVLGLFARVKTAFAGVTYPQVKVGISGYTDRYIKIQPINNAGDLMVGPTVVGEGLCEKIGFDLQPQATAQRDIFATFSSASGNLSSLSAGEIEFVVVYAE